MAKIKTRLREDDTLDHVENGRSGVGASAKRELCYADESGQWLLSLLTEGNARRRFPSLTRLAYAPSSLLAAARLIALFPPSGMAATNLQDAMEELATAVAAAGGGTIGGSATAGSIPKMAAINSLAASILSEVGGAIVFEGDSGAAISRHSAGALQMPGALYLGGDFVSAQMVASVRGRFLVFSPGLAVSADATYNVGAARTVILTATTAEAILPPSASYESGTEFHVYFKGSGEGLRELSMQEGTDVFMGLVDNLGLGIEGVHVTIEYSIPVAWRCITDGAGKWYIAHLPGHVIHENPPP